jgi:hypothetical protein
MSARQPVHGAAPAGAPWYRQFWPWFLIALPSTAVIASFASLAIALRNADSLVRADWSDAGENINVELALEREAQMREIAATIIFDSHSNRLLVSLVGRVDEIDRIAVELRHPTDAGRDVALSLAGQDGGVFVGESPAAVTGSWYLTIAPPQRQWLLRKRVWLSTVEETRITAGS